MRVLADDFIENCLDQLNNWGHDAFHVFGVGVGQAEVIGAGLVVSTALVVGYRRSTRRRKYDHE